MQEQGSIGGERSNKGVGESQRGLADYDGTEVRGNWAVEVDSVLESDHRIAPPVMRLTFCVQTRTIFVNRDSLGRSERQVRVFYQQLKLPLDLVNRGPEVIPLKDGQELTARQREDAKQVQVTMTDEAS
ncbi:MAG TPA: hypothetical protein VF168_06750 [Trueperaceae bacterium]